MARTVTHNENNQALWGDEDFLEAAKKRTFTEMIFELLSERKANSEELELFNLMLNLSIDHGNETPSAKAVLEAIAEEKEVSEALAAGVAELNESHGGAVAPAMEILYKNRAGELHLAEFIKDSFDQGMKIAGLGHRIYKDADPRAELILNSLQGIGDSEQFIKIEQDLQLEVEKQTGKHLVINIDGAIAVAFCSMNFPAGAGKVFYIIARTPGLSGQYLNARK